MSKTIASTGARARPRDRAESMAAMLSSMRSQQEPQPLHGVISTLFLCSSLLFEGWLGLPRIVCMLSVSQESSNTCQKRTLSALRYSSFTSTSHRVSVLIMAYQAWLLHT